MLCVFLFQRPLSRLRLLRGDKWGCGPFEVTRGGASCPENLYLPISNFIPMRDNARSDSTAAVRAWRGWQRLLLRFGGTWVVLVMLTFPVPVRLVPWPGAVLKPLTTATADWVGRHVWGMQPGYIPEVANDTYLLWVHLGNMLVMALLVGGVWGWLERRSALIRNEEGGISPAENASSLYPRLHWILRTGARYFLIGVMLSYGLAKLFKTQFYVPEPNTLYTKLGDLPRDLLFWSTMGTSHAYSVVTGFIEVAVALLLMWRRTSLVGALLGLAVMGNVLLLDLCFDISVKVFAGLLCLLSLTVLAPELPRLWRVLRGQAVGASALWAPDWGRRRGLYAGLKGLVVFLLVFDALGPFVQAGIWNGDNSPRRPFHGAWEVETFVRNGDTLPPDLRETTRWRRVFVHRQGYWIVQGMDETMRDYPMELDTATRRLEYLDPLSGDFGVFDYQAASGTWELWGLENADSVRVSLRELDWRGMAVLRGEFHWGE